MLLLLLAPAAFAGNGPFFVTYDHRTHDPGAVEVMLLVDVAHEADGTGYGSYLVELGMGLPRRLQLDLLAEGFGSGFRPVHSTGFRIEGRWRVVEDIPLNPTVYLGYADLATDTHYQLEVVGVAGGHHEPSGRPRERVVETRLILSDDAGPVRVSFNWINDSDLVAGETAFGYALGASVGIGGHGAQGPRAGEHGEHEEHAAPREHEALRVGLELYGGVGDAHDFGPDPKTREHYASVDAQRHFGHFMVKAGASVGLTEVSQDLFRVGVGYEF